LENSKPEMRSVGFNAAEPGQEASRTYRLIQKAIEYFVAHQARQPGLRELSQHVGLSDFHLQRLFSEWVGVSPKQYLKFLTKEQAKRRLRENSVLEVALATGLSGGGRLYDLMLSCEGMTPGQYKALGAGLRIGYGVHPTPFGWGFLAVTERGVCKLAFSDDPSESRSLLEELRAEWPGAVIEPDQEQTAGVARRIFHHTASAGPQGQGEAARLKLLLKGSPFQLKVWEALLAIPEGGLVSYQDVANAIQAPGATRAVASAIARNSIGYLIPCHRVIRSNGDFSNYRWGRARKPLLIGWEASQCQAVTRI